MKALINKLNLEKINYISIIITILYLFIMSVLFTIRVFDDNKIIAIGFDILLPFILIIYILYKIKEKKFDKIEVITILLIILSALSVEFSINYEKAIMGENGRYEGFLAILNYYLLFLNARKLDKKYNKNIEYLLINIVICNAFYGFYQVGLLGFNNNPYDKARGFISNPNMYASLLALGYPYIISLFYNAKTTIDNIKYFILMLILSLASATTVTMSLYVGLIAIFILLIINCVKDKKKNIKNKILKVSIILITFILTYYIYSNINNELKKDIKSLTDESSSIIKGNINEDFGSGRMFIWKKSIPKIKDYILVGAGPDNFAEIFDNKLFYGDTIVFDKAHNDYLQKMLCEGLIAGILFICLLLYIFIKNIKKNLNKNDYGLFLSFTCYSIVAFFNISLIRVAPIYFIITGLISKENSK